MAGGGSTGDAIEVEAAPIGTRQGSSRAASRGMGAILPEEGQKSRPTVDSGDLELGDGASAT
jgi:hypothetical protein